ncbi:unnamed protein product [Paramecium primaurelia]|uniref:DNA polymerase n=1 Tax=Paramecium primaurelia TaxID=5886 RepID=A0A8S1PCU6_PARPR|nr:unnamed protein product [Paramecium primaurelia]
MNLPAPGTKMSQPNQETLFETLKYSNTDYLNRPIQYAPVIRLFGYEPKTKERMCVHVHGYFPYFYIKVEELRHLFIDLDFVKDFINKVHQVYASTFLAHFPKQSQEKFKIIYQYELCQKLDFYGFHMQKQLFLKLYMYDKQYMAQLVMLLASGAVMNYKFQSYESHLTYFMHFYSDANLFGMSQIKILKLKYRKRFDKDLEQLLTKPILFRDLHINQYSHLYKVTTCPFEIDCHYTSIINERYKDEKDRIEISCAFNQNKEFEVELTPSLNKLWSDEEINRARFKFNQPVSFVVDTSKNKEGQLWDHYPSVNVLNKQFMKQYFQLYQDAKKNHIKFNITSCFINQNIAQMFFNGQQDEMELCKKSIIQRFQEYKTRKKDLFELIKEEGNIDYEYDFDDKFIDQQDLQQDNEDEDLEDAESIIKSQDEKNVFDIMKENQKLQDKNKFRKKYHANKNNIKLGYIFSICEYCNNNFLMCNCIEKKQKKYTILKPTTRKPQIYQYKIKPPSPNEVYLQLYNQMKLVEHQYAYFGDIKDLYKHYNIKHKQIPQNHIYALLLDQQCIKIPENRFYAISIQNQTKLPQSYKLDLFREQQYNCNLRQYQYQHEPPTIQEVLIDIEQRQGMRNDPLNSIIEKSQYFYPTSLSIQSEDDITFQEDLVLMIFEIFSYKDQKLLPDPEKDEISFIILHSYNVKSSKIMNKMLIIQNEEKYLKAINGNFERMNAPVEYTIVLTQNEINLMKAFTLIIHLIDPDFISGYDLETRSLYYVANRAEFIGYDFLTEISRGQPTYDKLIEIFDFDEILFNFGSPQPINDKLQKYMDYRLLRPTINKRQSFNQDPKTKSYNSKGKLNQINSRRKKLRYITFVVGRVLINVWRNVATDIKIIDYSIENVYYQMFKEKNALIHNQILSQWFKSETFLVFQYYTKRIDMTFDILEMIGLIPRTIEIAKLFGCEYESVGFRGSQFKIESILNRVTKLNDYLLLSATRVQVSTQKILECMPLVVEPPKIFTVDPLIVLDFQSLYPSIMIAYNLCFSTCLGSIKEEFQEGGKKRFGVVTTDIDFESLLQKYQNQEELMKHILITPNNVGFLTKDVRVGIIPQILNEFLMTRIMIKKSTQLYDKYPKIQKQHGFRQLAIKLFMNVMYGYCGASFSGRMPSGDIADSVVELGRTILNQCIECINSNPIWQAKVLYGDTDSLFVMLPGRNVNEALQIGNQIAQHCTSLYPHPIELKFEKVYAESLLVAKKRYVGNKFEKGEFQLDGKGLEIIRRDGFPALQKIQRKAINILFKTKDLSQLKLYMQKQWAKILQDHVDIQDYIMAKEVKLGTYKEGRLPAHAVVATKIMNSDPMRRPKGGERVPYVVIQAQGTSKLADLVVNIYDFQSTMKLNPHYYIKQINAAVGRLFACFDIDIADWYSNLPKMLAKRDHFKQHLTYSNAHQTKATQYTLVKYLNIQQCLLCGEESKFEICKSCSQDGRTALFLLQYKQNLLEIDKANMISCCKSCSIGYQNCKLWSCSLLFKREKLNNYLNKVKQMNQKYQQLIEFMSDY